jgi:hypothetical protein
VVNKELRKQTQVLAVQFVLSPINFIYADFNSLVLVPVDGHTAYFASIICRVVPKSLLFPHVLETDTANKKVSHFGVFGRVGRIVPSVQGVLPNCDLFNKFDLGLFRVLGFEGLLIRIVEEGRLAVQHFQRLF